MKHNVRNEGEMISFRDGVTPWNIERQFYNVEKDDGNISFNVNG